MTEIERKALELVNEACRELDFDTYDLNNAKVTYGRCFTALCRAIEKHEALSAENERLRDQLEYAVGELSKYRAKYMVGTSAALGDTK